MKVAIMGTGGVGGYFGGRLARAGEEVNFIARGEHLRALRSRGLEVRSAHGDFRIEPVRASDDPGDIGPVDVVLFTVKSQDTRTAAGKLKPLLKESTAVISLQNGVDNEEVLIEAIGSAHVLGGVAYIEATIEAPGVIVHKSPFARLVFGKLDGSLSARAEAFLECCKRAGLDAAVVGNIQEVIWTKWLFICAFSGMTALTRQPIGPVMADEDTRELYRRCMEEIAALARAKGVVLPEGIVAERLEFSRASLPYEMRSSLQQDLAKEKPLEIDALNGYASRLGKVLGVPTPVNDAIYAALKLHKDGAREDQTP
jgi:2-dehydropantoate 2-reductase